MRTNEKISRQTVIRIAITHKRMIAGLADVLAVIAPATTRGRGFCVKCVADEECLGRFWKDKGNKRQSIAAHAPPRHPDPARWAFELGCWDLLETCHDKCLSEVSRWLGDQDRLDTGCHLVRRAYCRERALQLIDDARRHLKT